MGESRHRVDTSPPVQRGRCRVAEPRLPCQVKNCKHVPTERKPYCLEHIDRMPYAKHVMDEWKKIQDGGPELVREIRLLPEMKTIKRAAVFMDVHPDILEAVAKKAGLYTEVGSTRGTPRKLIDPFKEAS